MSRDWENKFGEHELIHNPGYDYRRLATQAAAFQQEGGFTERLYRERTRNRQRGTGQPVSPNAGRRVYGHENWS